MLQSKIRTLEETENYMKELKSWLKEARNTPAEEMADFFTKRIGIYENVHLQHWEKEYTHIADFFKDGLKSLLDIGCGTGLELASIYKRFPNIKITGIDLSKTMLSKLRKNYADKDITLIQADYFTYPFEEKQYDAAMSFETLHHFEFKTKRQIYEKLFRALKPGGYYIECDYIACCPEEEQLCLEEYLYRKKNNRIPENTLVHIDIPLTLEHQTKLMKQAGFEKITVLYENCGTMIFRAEK